MTKATQTTLTFATASRNGEIYIPFFVAAVPIALFTLLGFIGKLLEKPAAAPQQPVVVAMLIVQTLGIIATAIVFLMRYDLVTHELHTRTLGRPHILRKFILFASLGCLLLFDVLTNVAAAFDGARFLFLGSLPFFLLYVLFNRLAFAKLPSVCFESA